MDKETLSHYGWIVILVLILAVMLALATPFGTFIADGFKATYTGIFDVENSAMEVVMNATGGCTHRETEVTNVSDDYTGDTVCNKCGEVLEEGKHVVPEGGTYYVGVTEMSWQKYTTATAVYNAGDELPEISNGDVYVYGDYEYRYNMYSVDGTNSHTWRANETLNGWGVCARKEQKSYGYVLEEINGMPIVSMDNTFSYIDVYSSPYYFTLPNDFSIPSTVKSVERMFMYADIQTLPENFVIPEGVTSLYETFYGASIADASRIVIPNTVTNMENAFKNCPTVTPPVLPDSVTNLKYTFYGCTKLETAPVLPQNITSLYSTFRSCKSLVMPPIIPNTVTDMSSTFYDCSSLTTIPTIPSGVTNLGATFYGCSSLKDVSDIVIPACITTLSSTFENCSSLTNDGMPIIPNGITELTYTFKNCTGLTDLSNFIIPNSVKSIRYTFEGCTSLTDNGMPNLPDSITDISGAFGKCTSLVDLSNFVIPETVTSMHNTFRDCSNLQASPSIPSRVGSMGYCFQNCKALKSAPTLPTPYHMEGTFDGCTSLSGTITINNAPQWYDICFRGVDFDAQNITLTGSSSILDTIGATGTNYCAECNGKCNGGH